MLKALLASCDHNEKPLPEPLYSCAYCADEYSWPAEDLFWSEALNTWICDNCWLEVDKHWITDSEQVEHGITLAEELKNRGLSR